MLCQIMYFVTDCDGTIAHYDNYGVSSTFDLPPSSGSGRVAHVSRGTIELLEKIQHENVTLICASGMRVTTMLQRQPYFPSVKFWICENGGRIFEVKGDDLIEMDDWIQKIESEADALESIQTLCMSLRQQGWEVDDGYKSMIRVKGDSVEQVVSMIPRHLHHTYNLGYLDIHLPSTGKLPAVQWLISRLQGDQIDKVTSGFLFMGDDDNDVQVAAASQQAFIVKPCSRAMDAFISSRTVHEESEIPQKSDIAMSSPMPMPYVASMDGPLGTEELLSRAWTILRYQRTSAAANNDNGNEL
eukprot:gene5475-11015_t